jgi:hypothetical protein
MSPIRLAVAAALAAAHGLGPIQGRTHQTNDMPSA